MLSDSFNSRFSLLFLLYIAQPEKCIIFPYEFSRFLYHFFILLFGINKLYIYNSTHKFSNLNCKRIYFGITYTLGFTVPVYNNYGEFIWIVYNTLSLLANRFNPINSERFLFWFNVFFFLILLDMLILF